MSIEQGTTLVPILIDGESIALLAAKDVVLLPLAELGKSDTPKTGDVQVGRELYRVRAAVGISDEHIAKAEPKKQLPILRTLRPCLEVNPQIFDEAARQDEAVAICRRCLVEQECREETIIDGRHVSVVRGGLRSQQLNYRITQRKTQQAQTGTL